MKAIEQYFHVVLFIILYEVVLTFMSVDKTLVCDHSNESFKQYFHGVLFIMLHKVILSSKADWQSKTNLGSSSNFTLLLEKVTELPKMFYYFSRIWKPQTNLDHLTHDRLSKKQILI